MLIWILAIGLLVVFGGLGLFQGAVKSIISLFGLLLGIVLAMPIAPTLQPLMGRVGVTHPIWSLIWPPIIILFLVYFVFIGLAFFVHRKFELHFKYHGDELARIRWERANSRLGACVGLVMGGVLLMVLGVCAYGPGYLTVQVASETENPSWMNYLNQARRGLEASGLDRAAAKFDPMPAKYYEAADVIGLIYNNPIVFSRLAQYPPFLSLAEMSEFQDIAADTEYNTMLMSKGDIVQLMEHPKSVAIMNNAEIRDRLLGQDLADVQTYLKTGVSPKFADEKILGRWYIDSYATLTAERKKRPDITSSEMARLKKEIMESMKSVELVATPENKVKLTVEMSQQAPQPVAEGPNSNPNQFGQSPDFADRLAAERYGLQPPGGRFPRGGRPGQAPQQAQTPQTQAKPAQLAYSAEGSWSNEQGKYRLRLRNERNRQQTVDAVATEDTLTIQLPQVTLVFLKSI